MNEWEEYKISDIADVIGGGTPSTSNSSYWNGNIPWLTPRDLTGYSKIYISKGERNITSDGLRNSAAKLLPKGTVLLTSRAPIGYVAIAKNEISTNQGFKSLILKEDYANSEFVYYWIRSNIDYLQSIGTGTTFAEISGSVVKEISISLPSISLQKSIASILSSLDDKIDLLHRQNATLEKMAETLFRQWFVEEAKEEWKNGKVSDLIKILSGYAFKSSSFVESGKYRLITIKGVQDGYLELNNADKIEEVPDRMPDFCKLEIGDIILSLTGNVGRCCLVDTTDLLLNQRVAKLHPIYERDRAYTYFLFRQPQIKQLLEEMGKGTAQPNLSPIETSNMELIIPDEEKLIEFSVMATPLLNKMLFNKKSIQTLTALRDTLLPKLMSGEVRVD